MSRFTRWTFAYKDKKHNNPLHRELGRPVVWITWIWFHIRLRKAWRRVIPSAARVGKLNENIRHFRSADETLFSIKSVLAVYCGWQPFDAKWKPPPTLWFAFSNFAWTVRDYSFPKTMYIYWSLSSFLKTVWSTKDAESRLWILVRSTCRKWPLKLASRSFTRTQTTIE